MADVSLDDYITRKDTNFRVQISNTNVQRSKPPRFNQGQSQVKNRLGLQTNKVQGLQTRKNQRIQINKPVSVTLKGISKITFDARDKISTNQKPADAREKLNQGKGPKFKDARIQITNLKAQHSDDSQVTRDARQMITAKRQNSNQMKISLPAKSSKPNNSAKVTFIKDASSRKIGNEGLITVQGLGTPRTLDNQGQITVTGLGPQRPPAGQGQIRVTGLGTARPPSGQGQINVTGLGNTDNLIRTIDNNTVVQGYGEPHVPNQAASLDFSITRTINSGPTPVNPMMCHPIVQYHNDPYQDVNVPRYDSSHTSIPVQTVFPDTQVQTMYQDIPVQRINERIPVQRINEGIPVERINTVPPSYQDISVQRVSIGQMNYQEDYEEEDDYYEYNDDLQYSAPAVVPKRNMIEKTLTVKKPVKMAQTVPKVKTQTVTTAVKRKAPVSSGGPLKLYKPPSESVPVVPVKKTKVAAPHVVSPDLLDDEYEELGTSQVDDSVNVLSPLQGFKVLVSNLHPIVTQDDIIELFGAIGPMKKARLPKPGLAEIVYVQKDSALKAVQKYNNRELDGQPMQVKLLTSGDAQIKQPVDSPIKLNKPLGEPLRLGKDAPKKSSDANFDVSLLHKALFKTTTPGANKPVTFTVKI